MTTEETRALLKSEVEAAITAAMPGATLLDVPSSITTEPDGLSVSAFDASDTRAAHEVCGRLAAHLRQHGWTVEVEVEDEKEGLHAAKPDLGGGVFGVTTAAMSFVGLVGGPRMSAEEVRKSVSGEIRAAIRAATPKPVYPRDEYGPAAAGDTSGAARRTASVRVAGWDPDEKQSNEELLRKASAYLLDHDWRIWPEMTDSDDRSARLSKPGQAEGRLYVSNKGFVFTGDIEWAAAP